MKVVSGAVLVGMAILGVSHGCGSADGDTAGPNEPADRLSTAVAADNRPTSLTNPNWKHVHIPPDEELRAQAQAVPQHQRMFWGWDESRQAPMGWVIIGHDPDVFPVFSHDGGALGVGVAGIGLITRQQLTDPNVDLEQLARTKWGPLYDKMLGTRR
jgi:hypothetical protein